MTRYDIIYPFCYLPPLCCMEKKGVKNTILYELNSTCFPSEATAAGIH
jgi:hypothetical protein